jgi:hypothetical protein
MILSSNFPDMDLNCLVNSENIAGALPRNDRSDDSDRFHQLLSRSVGLFARSRKLKDLGKRTLLMALKKHFGQLISDGRSMHGQFHRI